MLLAALQELAVREVGNAKPGVRAALLYRAGKWDEAHSVAQEISGPDGSFWHGILHRHEQDWSNAAYWFRQVGHHAIFPALHSESLKILAESKVPAWNPGSSWDPFRLIEWCEAAVERHGYVEEQTVTKIQVAEWQLLYDWCNR